MVKSSNFLILIGAILFGLIISSGVFGASGELYNQPFLAGVHSVKTTAGQPVTVAVIDEGIDFSHEALAAAKNNNGWNFLENNNDLTPRGSHATQIASTILAASENSPNIKFMNLIACTANEGCSLDALIQAVYYAADNGASVINLSLEASGPVIADFSPAINYAYKKNVVVVAAAGNGDNAMRGKNLTLSPISPVCNDFKQNQVLGASSLDDSGQPAAWANFGDCVDIYAPGENIYAATSLKFNSGNTYAYKRGTSYSAAMASAAAAVIKSKNPTASSKMIIDIIIKASGPNRSLNIADALRGMPEPKTALKMSTSKGIIAPALAPTFRTPKILPSNSIKAKLYLRGPI